MSGRALMTAYVDRRSLEGAGLFNPYWGLLLLAAVLPGCANSAIRHALEGEIVALHQQVDALQARAGACADPDDSARLVRQLVQLFPASDGVEVDTERGLARVRLPASLLVEEGAISTRGQMSLDLISGVLAANPRHALRVTGRSDAAAAGMVPAWDLARRAADVLAGRFGVARERLWVGASPVPGSPAVELVFVGPADADQ